MRRKGYSIDRGNYIRGVSVLAVPVFNARRQVTHALVVAGVADQLPNSRGAVLAKEMRGEADRLAAMLLAKG